MTLDTRQYCEECALPADVSADLRRHKNARTVRSGESIRVSLSHPSFSEPETLWVDFVDVWALPHILSGEWDRWYLDPGEEGLPGGTVALQDWYRGMRQRCGELSVHAAEPNVEPCLVDFGTLSFDTAVTRTLTLRNPTIGDVRFRIEGPLAPPEVDPEDLPEILNWTPFRLALPPREPSYRGRFEFLVTAGEQLVVPISL